MKKKVQNLIIDYIPLSLAFVLIVGLGIKEKQSFIKMLPAIISLFVVLFSAHVNRIAFLIGAINCIFYSIGYSQEGLYGSVASALLFSMPIQIFSFFRWTKNKYKQATIIKHLNKIHLLVWSLIIIVCCCVSYFIFKAIGGAYVIFDSTIFVLGAIASILIMLGVIEGVFINMLSGLISITMWVIIVVTGNKSNITYLLLGMYTFYRTVQQFYNWLKLYKEQAELRKQNDDCLCTTNIEG